MIWKFCPHCGEKLKDNAADLRSIEGKLRRLEASNRLLPASIVSGSIPGGATITVGKIGQEFILANSIGMTADITSGTVTFTFPMPLKPPEEPPPAGVREPRRPIPGAPSGYA